MIAISRNVDAAQERSFDTIIVGGGVYGAFLLLEAVRRGKQALLIEKNTFGSGTSANNLRIIHGGLRYLQTMHLSRYRESVAERRWFLTEFPNDVQPLPCLMPLHGGVLRSPALLRAALWLNDWLSRHRNDGVPEQNRLPDGVIVDFEETLRRFPGARTKSLRGAALWFDAVMPDCQRIIDEAVFRACAAGGAALDRVEATGLACNGGRVQAVMALDRDSGRQLELRTAQVINAAGPDADRVKARLGLPGPDLFVPSLAWNIICDRKPLADCAVAIQPPTPGARVYFAHSVDGRLFVGTGHAPLPRESDSIAVPESAIATMIDDLNAAVPKLGLRRSDVVDVLSGQLPVRREGTTRLCSTATILRHSDHDGPAGSLSVVGVKFTTARSTAERVLDALD